MTRCCLLAGVAALGLAVPAWADDAPETPRGPEKEVFSTGVAKGRDRLDSATSTSVIKAAEIDKFGARNLSEVLRNIPGIRVEAASGEGNASYSIRGLPLASSGAKYLQFQEDGLPVLEFGDMSYLGPDMFMRADFNIAQIEAIRGGSASTFASNSPGGVINLISRTGDVEGGTVQVTKGLDYGENRIDASYGQKIGDNLRFHVGGFYHQGEGPRRTGYDAVRGGQIRFNITRSFAGGAYIRLYGKYLDDRAPAYLQAPVQVGGSNADPVYKSLPGFDIGRDTLLSPNLADVTVLDRRNAVARRDLEEGMHPVVKAAGVEAQFDVAGWTITERFRFADISGRVIQNFSLAVLPAPMLAMALGGPGARLGYATGPLAGHPIANPAGLNGNGLLATSLLMNYDVHSADNLTNDLRATRVWTVAGGKLTATAGLYHARQELETNWFFNSIVTDVAGGGRTALVNVTTATGIPQTQDGVFAYSAAIVSPNYRRLYDVAWTVTAPYAALNYHVGKVAIGGSLRYDDGRARGSLFGSELGGGRVPFGPVDINGNGSISPAESRTGILPLDRPAPVKYGWSYLSYSAGINYRVADKLALSARYSRGGRGGADRLLFTPAISAVTGGLMPGERSFDTVRQAEAGLKYRDDNLSFNATGFLANTGERNLQINSDAQGNAQLERIVRSYRAYGVELEAGVRSGIFALNAGATLTKAEISDDATRPELVGNTPRHQAGLIFQATPQIITDAFTVGANVVGTTASYAQDTNQLRMPGFTTVNAFVQVRPRRDVQLMLNANNLFDVVGIHEVTQAAIPATGIVTARTIPGRTVSASLRFDF